MRYRPEYQLDRLRTMRAANVELLLMHFQWLRTFVVELPCLSNPTQQADERVTLQQRSSIGGAVERVVLANLTDDQLSRLMLPFLTQSVSVLTSLDVRGCDGSIITDDFLIAVANAHGATLQRLCLPDYAEVAQSTLDN